MALLTVTDIISEARVLLQDTTVIYRYSDAELLSILNRAHYEARRIRPDLFNAIPNSVTQYSAVDATVLVIDVMYRPSLLYYIVGSAHTRDDEEASGALAAAMMSKFTAQLLTVAS
jgi:hypothetical protein